MPYIEPKDRHRLDRLLAPFLEHSLSPGELNYVITRICHTYLQVNGKSYTHLNDIHGVLTAANLEFYRRVTAPYEDEKIKLNGDV